MFFETYLGDFLNLDHVVSFYSDNTSLFAYDIRGRVHEIYEIDYTEFKDYQGEIVKMDAYHTEMALAVMVKTILFCSIPFYKYVDLERQAYEDFIASYNELKKREGKGLVYSGNNKRI